MTTPPTTHAQRFAAVVVPALREAGYTGHGSQARLARDTGMSESSVSRMLKGQTIPELRFLAPLAEAIDMSPIDLLIKTGLISPESLPPLSETEPSQVGSGNITPEDAAERLGITDEVGRQMLIATIERLRRLQDEADNANPAGGTAAQI
ncbi:helix-turn-helix domain-containing protein [Streptomyces acidicola]|uniref:helix-turn-helix domain-containing protein n=1 Tax=Streptomyces acidicola TaxID=2596892 RepID=UPI00378757D3